jgi:hypothetical protein
MILENAVHTSRKHSDSIAKEDQFMLFGDNNNEKPSAVSWFVSMPEIFGFLWKVTLEHGFWE